MIAGRRGFHGIQLEALFMICGEQLRYVRRLVRGYASRRTILPGTARGHYGEKCDEQPELECSVHLTPAVFVSAKLKRWFSPRTSIRPPTGTGEAITGSSNLLSETS